MDQQGNVQLGLQQNIMASSEMTNAENWRQVTCPVCWKLLLTPNVPKILSCSHSCCLICLEHITVIEPGHQISCPVGCGVKTAIPKGVNGLETDVHKQNMVKELGYMKGEPRPTAVKCTQHGDEMNLYCQLCKCLACQNCVSASHKGSTHEIKTLASISKEQKEVFESVLNDTKDERLTCEQSVQDLKTLEKSVVESLELEAGEINRTAEARMAEIQMEAQALKAELLRISYTKIEKIKQEADRLEKQAKTLKNVCHVAEETSGSPDYAYVTQHDSLIQRMKVLGAEGRNLSIDRNPVAAKFVKETGKPVSRLGKMLKVVTPRKLQLVQEFDNFEDACKIALLSNNLLAVSDSCYSSKQVIIYHQRNGLYEKKMTLSLQSSNPWGPRGIVICPDGTFLVARKIGIEVYSSTGEYQKMITTRSKEFSDEDIDVVSVTALSDGRFLAGDIDRCIITEHDSSGKILWMLRTPIRPVYIASIQNKQVAITDHNSNKMVVMDIKSGKEVLRKEIPLVQGICYDEQTESLLIVRNEGSQYQQPISRTGVVEQYCCSTGRLVARLTHGLYFPKGIALTSDGMFAAADQTTVKVYRIK